MLKRSITYTDYNGEVQTEDFYFNLSKADLAEMELSTPGGMVSFLNQIVSDKDGATIIKTFKMFIGKSIGIRSDDGRRFMRSDEITNNFLSSAAYEELFMELVTNANAGVEFITGIIPNDLSRGIENVQLPEPTIQDLLNMDDVQFYSAVGENPRNWSKDVMAIAMKRRNTQAA